MKKFIGRDKDGKIIVYEEIKDVNELGDVKEEKNKTFANRTDFFNYWFAGNWDMNLELRYQGARLVWFLLCFPFVFIKRCFLIVTENDWGENYNNFSDFLIKIIIPSILILFLFYWIPGRTLIKIWNQSSLERQHKEEKLIEMKENSKNNNWKEEARRRREQNGEVYLGPEIGWYKIEGLPRDYEPEGEMNDLTNPPRWKD